MNKQPKWLIILIAVCAGTCLLTCMGFGAALRFAPAIARFSINQTSLKVGTPAPDFEATTLSGEKVRLSQYQGKPILLTFGATWCPDCRMEAPLIQELHENHPELVILLVDSNESASTVQEFVDEIGITHPVLLDRNGSISRLYQIFAIPTELFIDTEGIIQAKIIERVTPETLAEKLPLIGVQP